MELSMCTISILAFHWPVVEPALVNSGSIKLYQPSISVTVFKKSAVLPM